MSIPYRFILLLAFLLLVTTAAAQVSTGGILVTSTPTGATACVDGTNCQTTPARFDTESAGVSHQVTVALGGVQVFSTQVTVLPQQDSQINADLVLLTTITPTTLTTASGSSNLQVWVTPGVGTVCIDNGNCQNLGTSSGTGSVSFNVAGNTYHTVDITANGYQSYSQQIFVTTGQTATLNAALVPTNQLNGNLQIFVTPGQGTVCIDGSNCQNVGPSSGTASVSFNVAGNSYHTVDVTAIGYQTYSQQIYVNSGQTATLNVQLGANNQNNQNNGLTGSIFVTSSPSGATACIDGSNCQTTPATFTGITSGVYHTVSVNLNGYQQYTQNVNVNSQQQVNINAILQSVGAIGSTGSTGSIQVSSQPSGATSCIDGGDCDFTPNTFSGVSTGIAHTITVTIPGYQPFSQSVSVNAQQTININAVLQLSTSPTNLPSGTVQVNINPGGGTVCLDSQCQQNVGSAAGAGLAQFTGVTANTYHTISVTEQGYITYSNQVLVQPNQINSVTVSLTPLGQSTAAPGQPAATPASRAGIPVSLSLIAAGIGGAAILYRRSGK